MDIKDIVEGGIALAPMAGITDSAFRSICMEYHASYTVSEMISAKALSMGDKKTKSLLKKRSVEKPFGIQLFGHSPDDFKFASEILENDYSPDFVDINMGCPAPKIVKNGEGCALMKNPRLVRSIVKAVVHSSSKPVTVKIRKGWDEKSINALEIATICEEEGASAVTIHGRTREQQYSGKADWSIIKEVKKVLTIPVIANGDIKTPEDAKNMLDITGCDAIMVGRGALGNPWIFKIIGDYLGKGVYNNNKDNNLLLGTILRHYSLMEQYKGERTAVLEMRKHIGWYFHGFYNSAKIRAQIFKTQSKEEVINILKGALFP